MKLSRPAKAFAAMVMLCWVLFPVALFGQGEPVIDIPITIEVAPNVLNLGSAGTVVTVHTDIPYDAVVGVSVLLNSVAIAWWKSDLQGNFVAKFAMEAVKELRWLNIGGDNQLTLIGTTVDGETFGGAESIRVIDIVAAGR